VFQVTRKIDIQVPVLIVGGGAAGLTASILLSRLGVSSLLVNRYPSTSTLPRGHILNQRTMEIFTDMGVAPEITARATPPENMRGVGFYSGLAGGGPDDGHGRRLGFVEGWGAGYTDPDYIAGSPYPAANLSLLRTEPILRASAEDNPDATVSFNHELVNLEQDADGVTSTVLDRATGETYTVRSLYVLGADGGRTVAELVGIKLSGTPRIRSLLSLYVSADLSQYLPEADDAILIWIFNPEHPQHIGYGTVIVPQGPQRWGRESEEWQFVVSGEGLDASQPQKMLQWAREAMGIPDLEANVLAVSEWYMESLLADDFQAGRVFLLGDAAHRFPPLLALGLNSAVQDAYNLCWKIAAVLAGRAGDDLLDTYSAERRPIIQDIIDSSNTAAVNSAGVAAALGVSPEKSVEENWGALRALWEDLPSSVERRHEFTKWLGLQSASFRAHNIEFGYTYDSAAIIDDGTPAPVPVDKVRLYQPSTRPGHPLPHAWVERAGERLPLRSLIHDGHFALIAGEDGQAWVDAAAKIGEQLQIPLRTARVGLGDVDLIDVRMAWLKQRSISPTGAVLVRPDGYIAFRSIAAADDPVTVLSSTFSQILNRTID
jgi:2,4-dichlorophenol 6-monooxygenase